MGNSLHNKIYLGRRPALIGGKAAIAVIAALAGTGLVWLVMHTLR